MLHWCITGLIVLFDSKYSLTFIPKYIWKNMTMVSFPSKNKHILGFLCPYQAKNKQIALQLWQPINGTWKNSFLSASPICRLFCCFGNCVVALCRSPAWTYLGRMQKTQRLATHCALLPIPPHPILTQNAPSTSPQEPTTSWAHSVSKRIVVRRFSKNIFWLGTPVEQLCRDTRYILFSRRCFVSLWDKTLQYTTCL